jgi:hypothetical protein
MSKIVLIAYHSEKDSDVSAVLNARSALFHMPSDSILERFEIFDVIDSNQ